MVSRFAHAVAMETCALAHILTAEHLLCRALLRQWSHCTAHTLRMCLHDQACTCGSVQACTALHWYRIGAESHYLKSIFKSQNEHVRRSGQILKIRL